MQYGGRDVPEMEAIIDERFAEWISYVEQCWTSSAETTRVFDIARSVQYLTTDIITHLCFGAPMGFVRKHEDLHEFLQTLENRLPIAERFSVFHELFTFLAIVTRIPVLKRHLIPNKEDGFGVGRILRVR